MIGLRLRMKLMRLLIELNKIKENSGWMNTDDKLMEFSRILKLLGVPIGSKLR